MSRARKSEKDPLYRSVNTRTHNVRHNYGGEYRWSRQRGDPLENKGSMHAGQRRGRDYTPLFRFLLARVGEDWTAVHREAVSRLDREEPIFWLVARNQMEKRAFVVVGENSYYSGLYVDEENRLAIVDPALSVEQMEPTCSCCTHTFNGKPFTKPYKAESGC
ncbi:hypothetical protein [Mesorhizobium sp. NPDC059025]|uniref:hypothetical protein n=1 Tax=unclassified Mesorhizobium TaxID=325217 RepID=UPI00367D8819